MSEKSNEPKLLLTGREILTKLDLARTRREFRFSAGIIRDFGDLEIKQFSLVKLQELSLVPESTKIQDFAGKMEVVRRVFSGSELAKRAGLGWHIDDCQLVSKKTPPSYNPERFIHLYDDQWLYINGPRAQIPRWTMILYLSTEGRDFEGGRLRLADAREWLAEAGLGLLIDSREVHMVSPVKSGTRKSIIIKIY
jgi:hypothetical protein